MKRFSQILFFLALCSLVTYKVSAQNMTGKMDSNSSSLTKLVAGDIMMTGKKVMSLADAMPAKDYSWRSLRTRCCQQLFPSFIPWYENAKRT